MSQEFLPQRGATEYLAPRGATEYLAPRGATEYLPTRGGTEYLTAPGSVALVFPGQGSQYVGMGRDLYERYAAARGVFEQADALLGFSLAELCFNGPEDELNDTVNAQPAILAMSAAVLAVLKEAVRPGGRPLVFAPGQSRSPRGAKTQRGRPNGEVQGKLAPAFVAGHSLGEYTAWLAGGVLDLPTILLLVRERGRVMKEAGDKHPGAMAAVLGMDVAALQAICSEVGDVWLANDNSPGQTVLSGRKPALERALQLASARGARKTVLLAVSIAGHSPLMASAAKAFAPTVGRLPLARAVVPIIANVTAVPLVEPADIRLEMLQHLTSGVRWVDSVRYMVTHGVQTLIEVGPKDVLSGLSRRIDRNVRTVHVGTVADVEALGV